jgi:DNA helicase-2/ATP-dependent DNA helicase PcrA
LTELFDRALDSTGYQSLFESGDPELAERWENVLQLRTVVEEWEHLNDASDSDQETSLTRFLEETALVSDADTIEDKPDRVTLITLHAVKGLEFPVVFIVGAEEGLIPHYRSIGEDPSSMEEERRLFYVGITRAEERLYISYARQRSRFGFRDLSVPSPFLGSIPEEVIGELPTSQPRTNQAFLTQHRRNRQQESAETAVVSQIKTGDRVFHNSFGDGIVKEVVTSRDDQELVIEFKRHGTKRLLASMANLTIG